MVHRMQAASDPTERPSLHPVIGVSVSVWRDGRVLLIKRGKAPSKGLWAPVGGRLEWGETLEAAAMREVREETSVTCAIAGFSQLREIIQPHDGGGHGHHVVLAVFAAHWVAGEAVAGDDADDVAWVDFEGLSRYDLVDGVIPYIAATRSLIA
jgi:ADP-ribose pyrophosphatase YjhB (NUDIX family)